MHYLPDWVANTEAAKAVRKLNNDKGEETLLPMAFTAGSPTYPAYGAVHGTVAGICVTVLKAFFKTFDDNGYIKLSTLIERPNPFLDMPLAPFKTYITGTDANGNGRRTEIADPGMTIEGELNKLAMNVAMGRTMGGVH